MGIRSVFVSLGFVGGLAGAACAATTIVSPGPGTPLQDAIDAAAPGDRLVVENGTYPESIVIDKALKILGRGANITAGCGVTVAVEIAADGVDLRNVRIDGGTISGLVVNGRSNVVLKDMGVFDQCNASGAGIEIVNAVGLQLRNVRSQNYTVGTRLADFPANAKASLVYCGGHGAPFSGTTHGILIENVGANALSLRKCQASDATVASIALHNADGVRIAAGVHLGFPFTTGVVVDADSSDNSFLANQFTGHGTDVDDQGTSNCWRGNRHSGGGPLTGNPSTAGCGN